MKLNELISSAELGVPYECNSDCDAAIVTENAERVVPDGIFVCVNGKNFNGHDNALLALSRGASLVVGEEELNIPNYLRVKNARDAVSKLSRAFFGKPDKKLSLIGITGTNGKTTTAEYIRHILNFSGEKCGVIGTLGWDCGNGRIPSDRTTPDSFTFFSELKKTVEAGCRFCAAEVSSQALDQFRVNSAEFDLAVLTNIGHDHLDYHKTVRDYADTKKKLFEISRSALINADDAYRDEFVAASVGKTKRLYSAGVNLADFSARSIRYKNNGGSDYIFFDGTHIERVSISAPGKIGVYNSLCAASAAVMLGVEASKVAESLGKLPAVSGRSEMLTTEDGVRICIDYAHTPEALGAVLSAVCESTDGRVITVFGCGGDRDTTKRPVMGRIAASMSDCVILTSDNPRSEDPEKIIADISSGIKNKGCLFREPDRAKAIELALKKASSGDTVLVAGKGHEREQIINGMSLSFSDAQAVSNALKKLK